MESLELSTNGEIIIKYEKTGKTVSHSTDVSNLPDEYRDFYKYIKEVSTKKPAVSKKKDSTVEMIFSFDETSIDFVTRFDLLYYI